MRSKKDRPISEDEKAQRLAMRYPRTKEEADREYEATGVLDVGPYFCVRECNNPRYECFIHWEDGKKRRSKRLRRTYLCDETIDIFSV